MSARVSLALLGAAARHRRDVRAPVAEALGGWHARAQAIGEPALRALALAKLGGEGEHARAATMLATLAPRARRAELARTILATELLYDYLDGRTETGEDSGLHSLFTGACAMHRVRVPAGAGDGAYLAALAGAVAGGLAALPASGLVRAQLAAAAGRAAAAQRWAHERRAPAEDGEGWRERLAGAGASVLCVHALALRAAQESGPDPGALDAAYLELASLATLLDGLVDRAAGEPESPYLSVYPSEAQLAEAVHGAAERARARLSALGARHEMMLAGLIAHYRAAAARAGNDAPAPLERLRSGARPAVALATRAL